MMTLRRNFSLPASTGLFGGAAAWYAAHELGLYFSAETCRRLWLAPSIHVAAFLLCCLAAWTSARCLPSGPLDTEKHRPSFVALLGIAAAALFGLVVVWQGLGTIFYTGCER